MAKAFAERQISVSGAEIFARTGGAGPPLLLLHGFPETHLMWRDIVPQLAERFSVVTADLRGYGQSSCPDSDARSSAYSKRSMANDMVETMHVLGFDRFAIAGHDRGGRVAYRLALDHPECVERLAVLDIIPGNEAWDRADARFALGFWPWSLLAQPAPLPERLLELGADAIIEDTATQWGTSATAFPTEIRAAYADALRTPEHAHAICEEYRAAAGIDREHDSADLAADREIKCPLLVLWSAGSGLDTWYADAGGPLGIWRRWGNDVRGQPVDGGHFFPEERPNETADLLSRFFSEGR